MKKRLGEFQLVKNIEGYHGPVRNQFVIHFSNGVIFQSYHKVIAIKHYGKTYLDSVFWDCSRTTGKYRNIFLNETKKETERRIKNGEYILTNLNY